MDKQFVIYGTTPCGNEGALAGITLLQDGVMDDRKIAQSIAGLFKQNGCAIHSVRKLECVEHEVL